MDLKQDFLEGIKKRHKDILERFEKSKKEMEETPTEETPKKKGGR